VTCESGSGVALGEMRKRPVTHPATLDRLAARGLVTLKADPRTRTAYAA
jgi:hypothetical protein